MKLIPKAKPVRIRISSGGEEHYSLESLQRKFVWKDIVPLLDGQLVKWLRRINEEEIANRIEAVPHPDKEILKVYNTLFKKDAPLQSTEEVFDASLRDFNLLPLAQELLKLLSVSEQIKYGEKYSDKLPIFTNCLIEQASRVEYAELYDIGLYLIRHTHHKELGEKYIVKAAENMIPEAVTFAEDNLLFSSSVNTYVIKSKLKRIYNTEKVQTTLMESWNKRSWIHQKCECAEEQAIYEFSNTCLKIYNYINITGINDTRSILNRCLKCKSQNDIFAKQKKFIHAVLTTNEKQAEYLLSKIQDYQPARQLTNGIRQYRSTEKLPGRKDIGAVFEAANPALSIRHLDFFVRYMLDMYD